MSNTLFQTKDYRGATVEDLDIRPAISINPSTPLSRALQVSFEHDFTFLPVIHEGNKRLLGVLNVLELQPLGAKEGEKDTKDHMLWFSQKAKNRYAENSQSRLPTTPLNSKILKPKPCGAKKYQVITPSSPLEDLSTFFNDGEYFAIVTNNEGNLVYGVVTPEDLQKYEHSRPRL